MGRADNTLATLILEAGRGWHIGPGVVILNGPARQGSAIAAMPMHRHSQHFAFCRDNAFGLGLFPQQRET